MGRYGLYSLVRKHGLAEPGENTPIKAYVRGPYGSPFQSCFSNKQMVTVLVGSGTGLTSALSVLKEVIRRRQQGHATSEKVRIAI
jgi:NAD(P)H-flavin reductase